MPFFAPLPVPDPEPELEPHVYDWPGQRPDHWLPGAGPDTVVLARTPTTAVVLSAGDVFPRGLVLRLTVLASPLAAGPSPGGYDDLDPWGYGPRGPGTRSPLRLGLEWADGRRVESGPWEGPAAAVDGDFRLALHGGGGGPTRRELDLWLSPLPPAEPVTVHLLWEPRGIEETSVVWDLAPVVSRADSAEELWHLDPPPTDRDVGWVSYGPKSGLVVHEPPTDDGEDVDEG